MNHRRAGFTLIEVLLVLSIIAALMVIVFGEYQRFVQRAVATRVAMDMKTLRTAVYSYWVDNYDFPKAGMDVYDPGTDDDYGFRWGVEDDGSPGWNGPYLRKSPLQGPYGVVYRYWKSYVSGTFRDGAGGTIEVDNVKVAAVTISNFKSQQLRDLVDEHLRKLGLGISYVGYGGMTDKYYITLVLWYEE
ncbi:MAG TPA: hypothetical protein DHV12_09645 [Thermotogae bacterium]|nr:hypothetical protein [Thermotogota bacterium]